MRCNSCNGYFKRSDKLGVQTGICEQCRRADEERARAAAAMHEEHDYPIPVGAPCYICGSPNPDAFDTANVTVMPLLDNVRIEKTLTNIRCCSRCRARKNRLGTLVFILGFAVGITLGSWVWSISPSEDGLWLAGLLVLLAGLMMGWLLTNHLHGRLYYWKAQKWFGRYVVAPVDGPNLGDKNPTQGT